MSEGIELYEKDGRATGIYFCSTCRIVFANKDAADNCHGKRLCGCGKAIERRFYDKCDACQWQQVKAEEDAKELARFEKANKISYSDYRGDMVYCDDNFYTEIEDALDVYLEGQEPEYVWACKDVGVPLADSDGIIENLLENMWEDADVNDINGVDELDKAITAFNEANKSIHVYQPDYSTAILVNKTR